MAAGPVADPRRRPRSEFSECCLFVDWTKLVRYQGEPLFERVVHIPNERGGGGPAHIGKLIRIGFKPGFADYLILAPLEQWAGLLIEAKRPRAIGQRAARVKDNQVSWRDRLIRYGYMAAIAQDGMHMIQITRDYFRGQPTFVDGHVHL